MKHLASHVFWALVGAIVASGAKVAIEAATVARSAGRGADPWLVVVLVAIFLLLIALTMAVLHLVRRFDATDVKLRSVVPSFTYYAIDRTEDRDSLLLRAQKIISHAEVRIVALNAWREEWPDGPRTSQHRDEYFKALTDASRRVPYRRLVQVDPHDDIATAFDQSYRDHFHSMLDASERKQVDDPAVELHALPPTFPSTFVLVDDKVLIWQLNEVVPPSNPESSPDADAPHRKRFRMRGVIIVRDDRKYFIKHFIHTYNRACEHVTHAVTRKELGPRSRLLNEVGQGLPGLEPRGSTRWTR